MRLLADLHVHSIASGHAFSTVQEMAQAAGERALELIAVCDHGPGLPGGAHPYHFWNMKVLPPIIGGVRVLHGVESNLVGGDGSLDLPDEYLAQLDIVAVGLHPGAGFDTSDAAANTASLLAAMANPLVDMVTHPGNAKYPVELDAVIEAAVRHDVVLEMNAHSFATTSGRSTSQAREREFAAAAREAGAKVAIGSDAHFHDRVGRFDAAVRIAEELGFTEDDFLNRDAERVLAHLRARRTRPWLDRAEED